VQVLLGATGGNVPVMGRLVWGWRFNVILTTYLVLLDMVGSGVGRSLLGCDLYEGFFSTSRVMKEDGWG